MSRRILSLLALLATGSLGAASAWSGPTATAPAPASARSAVRHLVATPRRRQDAGRGGNTLRRGPSVSENWAGYAVSGRSPWTGGPRRFSRVSGAWSTPVASCTPGHASYAAFWVGLGGLALDAKALEQVGTEADCRASGTPVYYAWYELVPAAPITMRVPVAPGDIVSASVTVSGRHVRIHFANNTRGVAATLDLAAPIIDLTSAEWIAEAPSDCDANDNCTPLPLTNFARVDFASARAESGGHLAPITGWNASAIELRSDRSAQAGRGRSVAARLPVAVPGPLGAGGTGFSVTVKP